MKKIQRLSIAARAEALDAGLYQTGVGVFVRLAEMNDSHLVNALLKALAADEPPESVAASTAWR